MPVVDPNSWARLNFGDKNAWIDFLGQLELWHKALAVKIRALGGGAYATPPLGDGGGPEWELALQQTLNGAATSLGIAAPQDFQSYDLNNPEEFASFTFLLAQEHVRLRAAAGL